VVAAELPALFANAVELALHDLDPVADLHVRLRNNTRRRHSTCGQLSLIAYETRYNPITLQQAA
jgi:hypothetical protein